MAYNAAIVSFGWLLSGMWRHLM